MSEVIIEDPILREGRLTSIVTTSKILEKYIHEKELFIEYDVDVDVEESILNIPLTATMLPLAWITGSDLYVGALDRTFKESMDQLQKFFTKIFPKIPFTTEIKAEKLVENKIEVENPERRTGLLFSGGVDSYYSLINNIHLNPRLVTMWGVDDFPYPEYRDHWEKSISVYKKYAEKKNLELNILKTNISQILNTPKIRHAFHKELYYGDIRGALGHSLILLAPAAPISIGRFDRFIIAASNTKDYDYILKPNAARPDADEKIVWADLSVKHDGLVERNEKIKRIVDYHCDEDFTLRVCSRSGFVDGNVNDGSCFKCLSTIMRLILAGYDPNMCGFNVDESTFELIKTNLKKTWKSTFAPFWKNIQDSLPTHIDFDVHGSKEFFEWFRAFNLDDAEKSWFYYDLYMWLPFKLAIIVDNIYYKYDIHIHDFPYNRDYARTLKQHNNNDS